MPRTSDDFQVFSARRGRVRRQPQALLPFCEELWNRVLVGSAGGALGPPRRLAMAGISEGAGTTTIAVALCHYLARSLGLQVLLVEADLRAPSLQRLGLAPARSPGLHGVLRGQCDFAEAVLRVEPLGFHVLPAGAAVLNPTAVVGEDTLGELWQRLGTSFDVVVVDCPPLNAAPEDRVLVGDAEATVLVLRSGRTLPEQAAYWLGRIGEYGGTVGAVCLNFVRSGLPSVLRSLF